MLKKAFVILVLLFSFTFNGVLIVDAYEDTTSTTEKINADNSERLKGTTSAHKNKNIQLHDSSIITQDYPKIVAKIGSVEILGKDFAKQVKETKYVYELNNKPKDRAFYEKSVLSSLITNALIDQIADKKKIEVSDQEVKEYLKKAISFYENDSTNDPNIKYFVEYIIGLGFTNMDEYINNEKVIASTKKVLVRNKLNREIAESAVEPTENEIDIFIQTQSLKEKDFISNLKDSDSRDKIKKYLSLKKQMHSVEVFKKDLLSQGEYEVFLPITLK